MNLFLALMFFCSLDAFFLKDSPDLLVRVVPEHNIAGLTLHYSFSVGREGAFFDAILKTPLDARIVGIYAVYDDGTVDDRGGQPYLYELSIYPRMLMPFSINDLEVVIAQARRKIVANVHVDEAIALLEYADGILRDLPVVQSSAGETKKAMLQKEVNELKGRVGR
jgi:hypothetical protein